MLMMKAKLLAAPILSAPWQEMVPVAVICGTVGLSGIAYVALVARRMRAQTIYRLVFEDWLFHVLLPLAAYAMLGGSAFAALSHTRAALFVIGSAALLLLFVGIHNAWDIVTHLVFVKGLGQHEEEKEEEEQNR